MSLLVYAISIDDARAPAAPQLSEICAAGLRALAEPVDGSPATDVASLVRYEETVEKIMRSHTILPMRFGSVLDGAEDVRELLRTRASEFQTALGHLAGAIEYGLRVSATEDPTRRADGPSANQPGAAYMHRRLAEHSRSQALCTWLDAALDGLVRDRHYRSAPDDGSSLSAAFLVDGLVEHDFRDRVTELGGTAEHSLSWSGPWPPYSFAAGVSR